MPRAKLPTSLCPDCFMAEGIDEPLIVRAGTLTRCSRGHTWAEMEDLDHRMDLAKRKREAMQPENVSKPLDEDATQTPFAAPKGGELVVSETDKIRLAAILGDVNDSATLYGSVWSLQADLKASQELVADLQAKHVARAKQTIAAAESADPALPAVQGGDMTILLVIPERHVQSMQDMAESQGTTLEAYVNAIVEGGMDSSWFF